MIRPTVSMDEWNKLTKNTEDLMKVLKCFADYRDAERYYKGEDGYTRDYKKAFELFQLPAELEYLDSGLYMAIMYIVLLFFIKLLGTKMVKV